MNFYKSQVNEVVVEVDDNVTLSTPYYLFEFISHDTKNSTYCIASNTSTTRYRFDSFNIEDKLNPVALDGEVNLETGTYDYKIYEQEDSENMDKTLTTSMLLHGRCRVIGEETEDTEYSGADDTNVGYGG